MTQSIYDATGISIAFGDPIMKAARVSDLGTYTTAIEAYAHTHHAFLGYDYAEMTINMDLDEAEEWLSKGLSREIKVHSEGLDVVWEGFVDEIELTAGGISVVRGPLMDIANRVSAVYSPLDISVCPPEKGDRTVTTIVENFESQRKYGIVEKVVSVGTLTDAEAEHHRDTFLNERREPETSHSLVSHSASIPSIRIRCLGYGHWLGAYVYNNFTATDFTQISDKIIAILEADPNGIFSGIYANYGKIHANAFLVPEYEDDDPMALTLIKELTAMGDADNVRWLFMIDNDRQPIYRRVPTTYKYTRQLSDNTIRLTDGAQIMPYEVKAGEWMMITDFLPGLTIPAEAIPPSATPIEAYRLDPRMSFIESATYTAPFGLSIDGNKSGKLQQQIAQIAIVGMTS